MVVLRGLIVVLVKQSLFTQSFVFIVQLLITKTIFNIV